MVSIELAIPAALLPAILRAVDTAAPADSDMMPFDTATWQSVIEGLRALGGDSATLHRLVLTAEQYVALKLLLDVGLDMLCNDIDDPTAAAIDAIIAAGA